LVSLDVTWAITFFLVFKENLGGLLYDYL
jgi:hypothetical protein